MGCDSQFDDLYPTPYEIAFNKEVERLRKYAPYGTEWNELRKEAQKLAEQKIRADQCRAAYYTYFFTAWDTDKSTCLQCGTLAPNSHRDIHINWHYPEGKGKHALDRTNR